MTFALDISVPSITMVQGKTFEPDVSSWREFLWMVPNTFNRWLTSEEYKTDLIKRQINNLRELPEKWDGQYAQPVSVVAAQAAATITYLVSGDYAHLAQFFPLPNGGIQVEWFIDGNELEIEIDEMGSAYVTSVDNKGKLLFELEFTLIKTDVIKQIQREVDRLSSMLDKK